MSAYPTAWSTAVDLVWPFGVMLLIGLVLLAIARRQARAPIWRRAGAALALAGAGGLGVAGWAASAEAPWMTIHVDRVHCAPWPDAVAWTDVVKFTSQDRKGGRASGWEEIGLWIELRADRGVPLPPPDTVFGHPLYALASRLWRGQIEPLVADEAGLPDYRYCSLEALEPPIEELYRTVQELMWAYGALRTHYVGEEQAITWCEADGRALAWPCISNAFLHHRHCRDRGDAAAYSRCRAEIWDGAK